LRPIGELLVTTGFKLSAALQHRPDGSDPIIRIDPRDDQRELVMARWGLVPWFAKSIPKIPHISARAETVHEKPLFREAFQKRRALAITLPDCSGSRS
jgi:putative SOS response-associated peptidase YedK